VLGWSAPHTHTHARAPIRRRVAAHGFSEYFIGSADETATEKGYHDNNIRSSGRMRAVNLIRASIMWLHPRPLRRYQIPQPRVDLNECQTVANYIKEQLIQLSDTRGCNESVTQRTTRPFIISEPM